MVMGDSRLEQERRRRQDLKSRQGVTTYQQAMGMAGPKAQPLPTPKLQVQGSQALEALRTQARTGFQDSQRQLEALKVAEGEQADPGGFRGLMVDILDNPIAKAVLKPLEILDVPRRVVVSGVKEFADLVSGGDASFSDFIDQVQDVSFGVGKFVDTGNIWLDRALGFVGDVALDPLTYATFGAGAAAKAGILAHGAEGRLALAGKVLQLTGDGEKAQAAAKYGLSGARKVLAKEELDLLGMPKAGVYLFGKHIPAVRVPLSGGLSEAGESALSRLRVAATSTKVGGYLQKGVTPQFLKAERLQLLRGEVPSAEFAGKLSAVQSRAAYRAAAQAGLRAASDVMMEALKTTDAAAPELRNRLHLLLEGVEQPASELEQRALTAWQGAFGTLWDNLDGELNQLDPTRQFGKVERYFPHVVSQDGRKYLSGGGAEAKKLIEVFGIDDLGPTSFFQPRRLVADGKTRFFGELLKPDDLTVKRLNEIANKGGFVGDFFETDIVKVAHGYALDWADQMGRVAAVGDMVKKGTITLLDQKMEIDPAAVVAAQRKVADAVSAHAAATSRATEASVAAARAVDDHLKLVQRVSERLASRSEVALQIAPGEAQAAASAFEAASKAFDAAKEGLNEARFAMASALADAGVDIPLKDLLVDNVDELGRSIDLGGEALRRYQELSGALDADSVLRSERLKEIASEVKSATDRMEQLSANVRDMLEFQDWLAHEYDRIVHGRRVRSAAPDGLEKVIKLETLKTLFSDSADQVRIDRMFGKEADIEGSFEKFLKQVVADDPFFEDLVGGSVAKRRFKSLTLKQADALIASGMTATSSPRAAHIGSVARIAQVVKFFGGVDGIPESMRAVFDAAVESSKTLGRLADWRDLVRSAPADFSQYERLLQRYGSMATEIAEDAELYKLLFKQLDDLQFEWIGRAGEPGADKALKQLARIENEIAALENKRYTLRVGDAEGQVKFSRIAQAELDAIGHTLDTGLARYPNGYEGGSDVLDMLLERQTQILESKKPSKTVVADSEAAANRIAEKAAKAEKRQQNALIADSANASRQVTDSSRVPISPERRKFNELQKLDGEGRRVDRELSKKGADKRPDYEQLKKISARGKAARKELQKREYQILAQSTVDSPWMVGGRDMAEMRHDAMFAIEEFRIVSEVSQRWAVLTERFANVGLEPSDQMLRDVMRAVRADRGEVFNGRHYQLTGGAMELRNAASRIAARGDEDIETAVSRAIGEIYDKMGDQATAVLGPRSAWDSNAKSLLDRATELERAKKAASAEFGAGSRAHKAAIEALDTFFKLEVYPTLQATETASGKWTREAARRVLREGAASVRARNSKEAVRKLTAFAERLESEAQFMRKMSGLYRQIDDPDFNAGYAMRFGLGRQATPSMEVAAREAAVKRLEERIASLEATARQQAPDIQREGQFLPQAKRTASEMRKSVALPAANVKNLQEKLAKLRANALYPKAQQDQEIVDWLLSMSHLDGWKLSMDDWAEMGIVPPSRYDLEADNALQAFLDARRAEGKKTFIASPWKRGTKSEPFVEVTRAQDVPVGAQLLEMPPQAWAGAMSEAELAASVGYVGSGRSVAEITANQQRDLDGVNRQIAATQQQLSKTQDEVRRSLAGEPVFRADGDTYQRVKAVDDDIQRNLAFADSLKQQLDRGILTVEDYNFLVVETNDGLEQLLERRRLINDRGPSRTLIPTKDLQNEMLRTQQQLIKLQDQKKALVAELERSQRLDAFKNAVQPDQQESLQQYLDRLHPGQYRQTTVQRTIPAQPEYQVPSTRFTGQMETVPATSERVESVQVWQKLTSPEFPSVPVPYGGPKRAPMVEQPFTRAEWESLFAGKPESLRAANAKREVGKVEQALKSERGRLNALTGQRQQAERRLSAAQQAYAEMRRVGNKNLAAMQRQQIEQAREAIALIDDTIAVTKSNIDSISARAAELDVLVLSGSAKTQQAALTKLFQMYQGFKKRFPGGLDDPNYKALTDMESTGLAASTNEAAVSLRRRLLSEFHATTDSGRLMQAEADLNNSGWMAWSQRVPATREEADRLLASAQVRLANAQKPVREEVNLLREQLGFGKAEDLANVFDGTPVEFRRDPIGFARQQLSQRAAEAAATREAIGASAGSPARVIPGTLDAAASEYGALLRQVGGKEGDLQQLAADVMLGKNLKMGLSQLVDDAQTLSDLELSYRGDMLDASDAMSAAAHRYDQALSVSAAAGADAERARHLQERLARLTEAVTGKDDAGADVNLLERFVADSVVIPPKEMDVLRKSVADGEAAAKVLGDRKAVKGMSFSKQDKLRKAVKKGKKAAARMAAAEMSDLDRVELSKMLNRVANTDALPDGPVKAVLSEALAADVDLAMSGVRLWDAKQQEIFASVPSRLVPSVRDGWTSLESWQLPGLQMSKELQEVFDNVRRVESPGLAKELNDFLHKYTRFFKTYATLSPGFHVRNSMSNTFMVFAAGADISNMRAGMKLYSGWLGARKVNGVGSWMSGLSQADRDLFEKALRVVDSAGGGRTVEAFAGANVGADGGRLLDNAATRGSKRLGEVVEGSGRFMLAYDSVARGMDFNTASARVKRFLFDYTDTTALDEKMRNIIPFWIWMSRNLPLQIMNQWQNPKAYAMFASLMRNVGQDDSEDIVPSWLKDQGAVKVSDNWYLAPDFGFTRLGEQVAEFSDPARLASYVNPALRLPVEILGQRRLYNNVPFSSKPEEVTGGPAQPVLETLLSILGQTKTTSSGETVTDPKLNYAILNLIPFLSQAERLVPATEGYKARQVGSLAAWAGLPIRQVTDQMREGEVERRKKEMQQMATAARQLGYTP